MSYSYLGRMTMAIDIATGHMIGVMMRTYFAEASAAEHWCQYSYQTVALVR